MTQEQLIRYNIAKQEFKDQMDPTDLSRSFFVDCFCNVFGFQIIRSNGKILAYDAAENKYRYPSEAEYNKSENTRPNQLLDFPPYEYQHNTDGNKIPTETHAFPDPSTTNIYENIFLLRQAVGERQFSVALTMINLLPTGLSKYQRFLLAHKILHLYNQVMNIFSLKELENSINFLCSNGLNDLSDASQIQNILLTLDQDRFNQLITYIAENIRNHTLTTKSQEKIIAILQRTKVNQMLAQTSQKREEDSNPNLYI